MIYRFDAFELDEGRFELRRAGELKALPRKSFDLLRFMLERAGRVVTKQELFEEFWNGEHIGESVLPVHVRTIRKTLGVATGSILHTVRGQGYIVACRVDRVDDAAPPRASVDGRVPTLSSVRRDIARDPLRALTQASGMLSLALALGQLGLAADSLELLDRRL
jgi:DNA-binding winged helix-turn-helix (wHTH) protein